jgi:hypothetical protein
MRKAHGQKNADRGPRDIAFRGGQVYVTGQPENESRNSG